MGLSDIQVQDNVVPQPSEAYDQRLHELQQDYPNLVNAAQNQFLHQWHAHECFQGNTATLDGLQDLILQYLATHRPDNLTLAERAIFVITSNEVSLQAVSQVIQGINASVNSIRTRLIAYNRIIQRAEQLGLFNTAGNLHLKPNAANGYVFVNSLINEINQGFPKIGPDFQLSISEELIVQIFNQNITATNLSYFLRLVHISFGMRLVLQMFSDYIALLQLGNNQVNPQANPDPPLPPDWGWGPNGAWGPNGGMGPINPHPNFPQLGWGLMNDHDEALPVFRMLSESTCKFFNPVRDVSTALPYFLVGTRDLERF